MPANGTQRPAGAHSWFAAQRRGAQKVAFFGSLASLLWMFRYRHDVMPGEPLGWALGIAGLALSLSIGAWLNLTAQNADKKA